MFVALAVAACSASSEVEEIGDAPGESSASTVTDAAGDSGPTVPVTGPPGSGSEPPPSPSEQTVGCAATPVEPVQRGVPLEEVGSFDGGVVRAAAYPLPDDLGAPWSQWGEGVVLPDGRFVSAVGDHRGEDGRSYFYEYDPATGELTRTAEVAESLGHEPGDWGYGKIHSSMVLDSCDRVVTSTYWGTRRDIRFDGSYEGDHLIRYDPATHSVESLGVPAPGHGLPSLAVTPDRSTVYVEAVEPTSDPDAGPLIVARTDDGSVVEVVESTVHTGFRDVLVDGAGNGFHAAGDGGMAGVDRDGSAAAPPTGDFEGWMRAAADPASDGVVAFASRSPEALYSVSPDGAVERVADLEGYVASLALSADQESVLYVPGAHGDGWEAGTPLLAADLATGEKTEIVRLNDLIEPALGLRVGGTYNVVADPSGGRVYVGLNAGTGGDVFGQVVLAVVEFDTAHGDGSGEPQAFGTCWSARPAGAGKVPWTDVTDQWGLLEPLTGMHPHAIAAGDANGDSWVDLFVGTFADRPDEDYLQRGAAGPSPDRLLLGSEDGFVVDESFPEVFARTSGALFADLDGDGDDELVAVRNPRGDEGAQSVPTTIYERVGTNWSAATELPAGVAGRAAADLDVDADGDQDLVVVGDKWGGVGLRVYTNEGGLLFRDASAELGVPADLFGLAVSTVDVDQDGWRDLVVNGDPRILRGGPDRFEVVEVAELEWETFGDEDDPAGVAVGDLDGDGRPDLVLGHHFNSTVDFGERVPVRVLLNRSAPGDIRFDDATESSGSPPLSTKSPHVSLVDVDNDGAQDIVTSAVDGDGVPVVLLRDATSDGVSFEVLGDVGTAEYHVTGVSTDLDRDGRVDLVQLAWEPSRPSRALRNGLAGGAWTEVALGDQGDLTGASVAVTVDGRTRVAFDEATTGYASGAPPVVHIGLGEVDGPLEVDITRPDGSAVAVVDVPANTRVGFEGCL